MDTRDDAVAALNARLDLDNPREFDAETDRWMINPFQDAWVISRLHRRAGGVTLYMVLDGHVQMFTFAHATYEQTYRQMLVELRQSPPILSSRLRKIRD